MAGISFAGAKDDREVRELLGHGAMDGPVRLAMTRDPDHRLAGGIEGDRHELMLTRGSDGAIAGMGARSVYPAYVDGAAQRVGYLGQFRVAAGRRGPRRLAEGFRALEDTRGPGELAFDVTCVLSDNTPALRLLERGLPGLPRYHRVRGLETLVIATQPCRRAGRRFRRATRADRAAIAACLERCNRHQQLAPIWDEATLGCRQRCRDLHPEDFLVADGADGIQACVAVWDQRRFKQVRVQSYSGWLKRSRRLVNAGLRLAGKPSLPPAPSTLPLAYLSHLGCSNDEPGTAIEAISAALAQSRQRGLEQLSLTMPTDHPFMKPLRQAFGAYRLTSQLYAVDWDDSRGAIEATLDGQPIWLEGAML